jgi:hypothetical protein
VHKQPGFAKVVGNSWYVCVVLSNNMIVKRLVATPKDISMFTRPDVARAHSVLAQHLQNPGQKHLSAVYHVWRYLYGTKYLAIRASQQIAESLSCL